MAMFVVLFWKQNFQASDKHNFDEGNNTLTGSCWGLFKRVRAIWYNDHKVQVSALRFPCCVTLGTHLLFLSLCFLICTVG